MRWRRLALAAASILLLAPLFARADIAPPPDSPDAHCTTAEQCPHGESCPYSFKPGAKDSIEQQNANANQLNCEERLKAKKLERRCRAGGNYAGTILYCPKGETGTWRAPGKGCSKC
jgi:hypothetical protein